MSMRLNALFSQGVVFELPVTITLMFDKLSSWGNRALIVHKYMVNGGVSLCVRGAHVHLMV